jgi:hypothetical protein
VADVTCTAMRTTYARATVMTRSTWLIPRACAPLVAVARTLRDNAVTRPASLSLPSPSGGRPGSA